MPFLIWKSLLGMWDAFDWKICFHVINVLISLSWVLNRWRTEKTTREAGEWEPIKILLQRENSAYTAIATRFTRTHKSGSKLGTHKSTRPGDKPRTKLEGLEAKANHKRRSNKMSAWAGADCPHSMGGPSVVPWQTVRTALAEHPKKPPECPVAHHEKRTVCLLRTVRHARTVRTQLTDHPPNLVHQKSTNKMYRTEDTKELMTNTKNT
jgi:hypothetical protein